MSIDSERERISLGLKQVETDPFDQFLQQHPVSTMVSGKVLSVDAKKIVVTLDAGLTGVVKRSEFDDSKEEIAEGEELSLYVVSAERRNQMVQLSTVVSHEEQPESQPSKPTTTSTLGDLMKSKFDQSE